MHTPRQRKDEQGFAAIALVLVLVPVLMVIGSYVQSMTERNQRLLLETREEQAMLAAESGIDYALNEARRGTLVAGVGRQYTFTDTLPNGSLFTAVCTYLKGDGVDNDADGSVDEADEDVFRVVSSGTTQNSRRRVAAYLGFSTYLPELEGAITLTSDATTITISGAARADGRNYTLAGGLVGSGNTFGIAITPPGDENDLDDEINGSEDAKVLGTGGSPSIGEAPELDVPQIVDFARNSASVVITNTNVSHVTYGSAAAPVVAYREGDVRIQGNSQGWGLLVVNGTLRIAGTFNWYGVIVCTGTIDCGSGTARVHGGMLQGPSSLALTLTGTIDARYSEAGVNLASALTGRYVAFNGWQEISTNN